MKRLLLLLLLPVALLAQIPSNGTQVQTVINTPPTVGAKCITYNQIVTDPTTGLHYQCVNSLPKVQPYGTWQITGGSSGPTIPATTNALAGDGAGGVIPLTFTPQNAATPNVNNDVLGATKTIGAQLRTVSVNTVSNPVDDTPFLAPVAWTASTAYIIGQVVTNGGNMYICDAGGTSAAAVGPTGTSVAQIADNTVRWFYYGIPNTSLANAPVVTDGITSLATCNTGLTKAYTYATLPGAFTVFGGTPNILSGNRTQITNTTTTGAGARYNNGSSISFQTTANKICINAFSATTGEKILIDNRYVSYGTQSTPYLAPSGYVLLDLTNMGLNKLHTITVQGWQDWIFNQVLVAPTDTIQPAPKVGPRIYCFGNSILYGAGFNLVQPYMNACAQSANLLGVTDVWNLGIGGTDWVATNSGVFNNYLQHVGDVISPGLVVFELGGINDVTDAVGEQAAVVNTLTALRANYPTIPIVVTGMWPGSASVHTLSGILTNENAIMAGVTAMNDSNIYTVRVSTDTVPWVAGTGNILTPTGNGNADLWVYSDNTHQTPNANAWLAKVLAQRLKALFPLMP